MNCTMKNSLKKKKKKKNMKMVWHSHSFLLSYTTVEDNFIIGTVFIFKLYFLRFEAEWII